MDIYKRLEKDHDKQRELIKSIKASKPGSEKRAALWTDIKVELEAHASAEEQAFYSKLMAKPDGTDDTRHAVEEHQQMHEMIEKLDAMDQSADVWDDLFGELAHKVTHHVDEEEDEFFPAAKDTLSDAQETKALKEFNDRKDAEIQKQEELAD
ncbi:hemerythrin domain-containing protein [Algimonas arctica]|nr:hemerythrin domain-containing protein [Algimonas arctica]